MPRNFLSFLTELGIIIKWYPGILFQFSRLFCTYTVPHMNQKNVYRNKSAFGRNNNNNKYFFLTRRYVMPLLRLAVFYGRKYTWRYLAREKTVESCISTPHHELYVLQGKAYLQIRSHVQKIDQQCDSRIPCSGIGRLQNS